MWQYIFVNVWMVFLWAADKVIIPDKMADNRIESFDFIVVGGGTAGCVVAGRLSESGKHTVLLLETGSVPDPDPRKGRRYYPVLPQKNAALEKNGSINFVIGEELGGGSSVNDMGFNRGSPFDYDNWAESTKDESWGYASMLKYFKKVENYNGAFPSDHHGTNGIIPVTGSTFTPGMASWLKAGQDLGYSIVDSNGPQKISGQRIGHDLKTRVSSYSGYIEPFLEVRPNLKVLSMAEVVQIKFDGRKATGVVYRTSSGDEVVVTAKKEIIVSAGAIGSPYLLLKSGLGPKEELSSLNIPVVRDLPVGSNLRDHIAVFVYFALNNKLLEEEAKKNMTSEIAEILSKLGGGPDLHWGNMSSQAFVTSSIATNKEWADTQLEPAFISNLPDNLNENLKKEEVGVQCGAILTRPKSHGTVALNKTNVNADPLIDFQYLTHPDDLQVLLEGIKTVIKIFEETPTYQKVGARLLQYVPPPCKHLQFRSDEFWRCYIRQKTIAWIHAGGTCKMGSGPEDPTAVVDPQLRVIGVEGLRIVDASVMPTVTNANTMAPVYGIAEKASDMILRSWL